MNQFMAWSSVDMVCGLLETLTNPGVTARNSFFRLPKIKKRNSFHISYVVFVPPPKKAETVSHPVNAWKNERALHVLLNWFAME